MIGLLAFFTRPDTGSLWWSVLLLLVTVGLMLYAGVATRPPRLAASAPSAELGNESPAVASLLTNGFVVTPAAAVATLLDLVARGWLRIEHTEHEVVLLTDRRGREGDCPEGLRAAGAQPHPQDDGRHADGRLRRRRRDRRAAPPPPLVAPLHPVGRRPTPAAYA